MLPHSNPLRTLMDWIDYRQLPLSAGGFSNLFLDYVTDFEKVRRFYSRDFRNNGDYTSAIEAIDKRPVDRATLTSVLFEQNTSFASPPRTFDNISLLGKQTTYAVVTGQQVGLFGGPLYTAFKTITAIKLARALKQKFPSLDFVPVFWIEGEDHDFPEMNNIGLPDRDGKLVKIEYLPGGVMPDRNVGAVGEMVFDASIDQTHRQVGDTLQKTEFTDALLVRLKECYAAGRTFNQSFAAWMNFLFGQEGLVFVSSNNARLKRVLSPLFEAELSQFPATSQRVIQQSAELEHSYHAQVKAKSINLFLFHKGGRYLIEPREKDFSLKGTRHFLERDELIRIARETPELLSPNVILRPIAQDILLPTLAYVAGPSEVAYQAQLTPVYEHLNVTHPVIYPRASASFVEERLVRAMEKYNLQLLDFFGDINSITSKVLEQISEVKLDEIFGNATRQVHDALNELKFGLKEVDPTLLGALETAASKVDINIGVLKEKAVAAQKRRNETAMRQIEKAANGLLPNGSLQEREVNILHFLNRYGPDLVQWLTQELDISGFKHQILAL